jgi:hypothetical protein
VVSLRRSPTAGEKAANRVAAALMRDLASRTGMRELKRLMRSARRAIDRSGGRGMMT